MYYLVKTIRLLDQANLSQFERCWVVLSRVESGWTGLGRVGPGWANLIGKFSKCTGGGLGTLRSSDFRAGVCRSREPGRFLCPAMHPSRVFRYL